VAVANLSDLSASTHRLGPRVGRGHGRRGIFGVCGFIVLEKIVPASKAAKITGDTPVLVEVLSTTRK